MGGEWLSSWPSKVDILRSFKTMPLKQVMTNAVDLDVKISKDIKESDLRVLMAREYIKALQDGRVMI